MDEDEWEAGKELPQDEKQRESANREIYTCIYIYIYIIEILYYFKVCQNYLKILFLWEISFYEFLT